MNSYQDNETQTEEEKNSVKDPGNLLQDNSSINNLYPSEQ